MIDGYDWEAGQQRLAAALLAWQSERAVVPILAALERLAGGAAIADCPPLAELLTGDGVLAGELVGSLVKAGLEGLVESPYGQLPLRHACRRASHTVQLARAGPVSLALTVYDGVALAALPNPQSAEFVPTETWSRIVAGRGRADRVMRNSESRGALQRLALDLPAGSMFYRDGRREALLMREAEGGLVVLRLQRFLPGPGEVLEFRIEDGLLLHRAAAMVEDSRLELAIAVLVAQGRHDAVPALGRIVTGTGPAGLRWSALRALIGLDTRAGLVLLGELAANEDEELGPAARGLQRDLIGEWPELEKVSQWRG